MMISQPADIRFLEVVNAVEPLQRTRAGIRVHDHHRSACRQARRTTALRVLSRQ